MPDFRAIYRGCALFTRIRVSLHMSPPSRSSAESNPGYGNHPKPFLQPKRSVIFFSWTDVQTSFPLLPSSPCSLPALAHPTPEVPDPTHESPFEWCILPEPPPLPPFFFTPLWQSSSSISPRPPTQWAGVRLWIDNSTCIWVAAVLPETTTLFHRQRLYDPVYLVFVFQGGKELVQVGFDALFAYPPV